MGEGSLGLGMVADHVVPETLLAFAKDQRYIDQVKHLFLRVLRIENEGLLNLSAGCLSLLLYGLLVLVRTRRTAGMDATGIDFVNVSRWRLVLGVLISAGWAFGVPYLCMNTDIQHLRGAARRGVFEEQRRRMIERSHAQTNSQDSIIQSELPLKRFLRQFLPALNAGPERPHNVAGANVSQRTYSFWIWVLRLHFALYCIDGRYPSLIHRLIFRRPMRACDKTALVNRPETTRAVGVLLFTQATVTLAQMISKRWICRYADGQVKRMLAQRSNIQFGGIPASPVESETALCAICRQARSFPACPSTCGHVFCWQCLQQWVTFNVSACPLCREPCEKQDIVLLRNYAGDDRG